MMHLPMTPTATTTREDHSVTMDAYFTAAVAAYAPYVAAFAAHGVAARVEETGGGCLALVVPLADGGEVLTAAPSLDECYAGFTVYSPDGALYGVEAPVGALPDTDPDGWTDSPDPVAYAAVVAPVLLAAVAAYPAHLPTPTGWSRTEY